MKLSLELLLVLTLVIFSTNFVSIPIKNGIISKRESDNDHESKISLSPPPDEFSKDSRFPFSDEFSNGSKFSKFKKSSKKHDNKLPKFFKFSRSN
jgi:hypothetical protein